MQRMEQLWRLSSTHPDFFLDFNVTVGFINPVNRETTRFFEWTDRRQTDRQTDRTNRLTPPLARGIDTLLSMRGVTTG